MASALSLVSSSNVEELLVSSGIKLTAELFVVVDGVVDEIMVVVVAVVVMVAEDDPLELEEPDEGGTSFDRSFDEDCLDDAPLDRVNG